MNMINLQAECHPIVYLFLPSYGQDLLWKEIPQSLIIPCLLESFLSIGQKDYKSLA